MSYLPYRPSFGVQNPNGEGLFAIIQSHAVWGMVITPPLNVTQGHLIIVHSSWEGTLGTPTCADTLGTVYTCITSEISAAGNTSVVFAGIATVSGTATITVTPIGGGVSYDTTSVTEFSGVLNEVDVFTSGHGNNGGNSQPTPLLLTTTFANDLLFAAIGGNHGTTSYTAGSGFTLLSAINGHDAQATEYAIQSTIDTYSANFVASNNDDYAMSFIAFKLAPATFVPGTEGIPFFDTRGETTYFPYVYHNGVWVPTNGSTYNLPDVANNFDPTIGDGLSARVGATVGTIDGTKAWLKTGIANTDWTAVGP